MLVTRPLWPFIVRIWRNEGIKKMAPTCLSSREDVENRYMMMAPLKQPHARNLSREQNLQQYTLVRKICE